MQAEFRVENTEKSVRSFLHFHVCFRFAHLQNEFSFDFVGFFCAYVCDLIIIIVAQNIETQAIAIGIDALFQFMLKQLKLTVIEYAFEYGILHSRSVRNALLGNVSQAAFPFGRGCIDIIRN